MKYTLNFALKLEEKDDSLIVYDPKEFAEKPISISVPEVVTILEHFIKKSFKEVGILEKASNISSQGKEKNGTDKVNAQEQLSKQKSITKFPDLKGLSGRAYIRKSKELNETTLNEFCTELTNYLQKCCLKISQNNFLSEEIGSDISGLREVLELRNYLANYTRSNKEAYQNGYLYIMAF